VSGTTLHVLAVAATVVYFCHFLVHCWSGWCSAQGPAQYCASSPRCSDVHGRVRLLHLVPTAPPWYAAQDHVLSGSPT